MNDMTSLRDLGDALDRDLHGPSPALRARVLADLTPPPARTRRGRARPRSTFVRRTALAGGLAAVLAAALLAVPTLRLWGSAPGASAQATDVLHHAAAAARSQPALTARPGQFVYIEWAENAAVFNQYDKVIGRNIEVAGNWLSADGSRSGLQRVWPTSASDPARPAGKPQDSVLPGCRDGKAVPLSDEGSQGFVTTPSGKKVHGRCNVTPAYLRGLPTSASGMRDYLYRTRQGQNPPDDEAFIHAGDLLTDSYLTPAEMAAVFEALTEIPGVTVVQHAVNVIGQSGIAVQQIFKGISEQLIFNPKTYAFIGQREVAVSTASGTRVGVVMDSLALIGLGVVDRPGQLP